MNLRVEPVRRVTGAFADRRVAIVQAHHTLIAVPTRLGRGIECTVASIPCWNKVSDSDTEFAEPLGLAAVVGVALDDCLYPFYDLATRLNIVEEARAGGFNE